MEDGVDQVLAGVGERLLALRRDRGTTLAALAADTGISTSTLSRLRRASGGRRWSCCCPSPGRTASPSTS
jgi:hypothetical protein